MGSKNPALKPAPFDDEELKGKTDHDLILLLIREVRALTNQTSKTNRLFETRFKEIESKLSEQDAKIKDQGSRLTKQESKMKRLESQLVDQEMNCKYHEEMITNLQKRPTSPVQNVNSDQIETKLSSITTQLESRSLELKRIQHQMEISDQESRRTNIIINELTPNNGESSWNAAERFVRQVLKGDPNMISPTGTKIIKGRAGKQSTLLSLGSVEDKAYLYSLVRNLKGTNFSLDDDLTPAQRIKKNVLLKRRKELLTQNPKSKIKVNVDRMEVDGQLWKLNDSNEIIQYNIKKPNPSPSL